MKLTSQQSEYRPTAFSAFSTALIVVIVMLICFCFSMYRSRAADGKPAPVTDPQMPLTEDHYIDIPYFTELDGMSSTLMLNNNETESMTAKVTIFSQKGKQLVVPPISLPPEHAARFSLKKLTANSGDEFESGNVQVFFHGMTMGITSQVSIVSVNDRLAFESVETEVMDFASTTLNGIVWTWGHNVFRSAIEAADYPIAFVALRRAVQPSLATPASQNHLRVC